MFALIDIEVAILQTKLFNLLVCALTQDSQIRNHLLLCHWATIFNILQVF